MPEIVRPNHTRFCPCDRCRYCRRKDRFETVSRATYDPDRKLIEVKAGPVEPVPTSCSDVDAGPVLAEEVSISAVTEIGMGEELAPSGTLES